jgi:SCY1-like protein 1
VLVAAFTRALRDPQAPHRIAGITGLVKTIKYYTVKDCATNIIPALSFICVDPNVEVFSVL